MWIDGQLVLDEWNLNDAVEFRYTAKASANQLHQIKIEYAQFIYNDAVAKLEWKTPNGEREIIPTRYLYPSGTVDCEQKTTRNSLAEKEGKSQKRKSKISKGIFTAVIIAIATALSLSKSGKSGE